jgi:hypothetical protein
MYYRILFTSLLASVALSGACVPWPFLPDDTSNQKAVILGRLATSSSTAKLLTEQKDGTCPNVVVTINGAPADVQFDSDCSFLIHGVQPEELTEVRVELVDLGVAGTVELADVLDEELIEILVETEDGGLTLSVERRVAPAESETLPEIIDDNNLALSVAAGLYEHGLDVQSNKFTLVGEAGESCEDESGWTVISGDVLVLGNKATFRNIKFTGAVEIYGNAAQFINCCFGDQLQVFGNAVDLDADENNDDDDEDDEEEEDDEEDEIEDGEDEDSVDGTDEV